LSTEIGEIETGRGAQIFDPERLFPLLMLIAGKPIFGRQRQMSNLHSATMTSTAESFLQNNLFNEDNLSCFTSDATLRVDNLSPELRKVVSYPECGTYKLVNESQLPFPLSLFIISSKRFV